LLNQFTHSPILPENFNSHFDNVVSSSYQVINKHAPIQTLLRKRRRLQQKPWITKGLLISIKKQTKALSNLFLKWQ